MGKQQANIQISEKWCRNLGENVCNYDSVLKRNQNAQYCKYAVRSKITSLFIERFLAPHEKTMVNLK